MLTERTWKAVRGKQLVAYEGASVRQQAAFPSGTSEALGQWLRLLKSKRKQVTPEPRTWQNWPSKVKDTKTLPDRAERSRPWRTASASPVAARVPGGNAECYGGIKIAVKGDTGQPRKLVLW